MFHINIKQDQGTEEAYLCGGELRTGRACDSDFYDEKLSTCVVALQLRCELVKNQNSKLVTVSILKL